MADEDFKRKLTAILSADVVGYSRLMGEDEAATVKTLETYKGVMFSLIKQHRGRVVDSPGDNLLAEFGSVVDAVQCAVAVQKELQARNASLPENRRMQFRIGINLGDVIEEQDRIYGDGVNIAARLEALADPGGICVSKTAFDYVESKLPLGYQFLGEQEVKNIAKPVGAYRVVMETRVIDEEEKQKAKALPLWRRKALLSVGIIVILAVIGTLYWNFYLRRPAVEAADPEKMAYPLPEKPSIAVLPFDNLSGDPEQEYLTDGITENIIMALSQIPDMFVIARNSTFTYKGKPIKVKQVTEELGVRYVLEGSIQKSGDRLRITAQLIDAIEGHHIWAERYDRELKDIFALQDEITKKIITAMQMKLTGMQLARALAKGTDNLEAYLKFLQGFKHFGRLNPDDAVLARRYFEEAIALDPEFATPYFFMGHIHLSEIREGQSKSPQKSIEQALKLAEKVLALDESLSLGHNLLGRVYRYKRQYEKAITACERAVTLAPNSVSSLFMLGNALSAVGRYQEAIPHFIRAIRVNPLNPSLNLAGLGNTYFRMERHEEAITVLKKVLHYQPDFLGVHIHLAACYAALGREEEARAEAAEVLRLTPKFSVKKYAKRLAIKENAVKESYIDVLRKAGLPD
jgi:adenylate cyclase